MIDVKYLIIGAGPSGLTLAHTLLDGGIPPGDVLVLERESKPGGLCRSNTVDGAPLDIGGGHFLDVKHQDVLDFLFRFMPEREWTRHSRISRINLGNRQVDHPLESNLWQLDVETQIDYLESIARAGWSQGMSVPESFAEWVVWKFGTRIAEDYMLPYNRKIWAMDPNQLGTYWLHKLPNVSFRETLKSCLSKVPLGSLPAHGVFLYPNSYGYGEVWERMGDALGDRLELDVSIGEIDLNTLTINRTWRAQHVFNSAPWHHWMDWATLPDSVLDDIRNLRNVSIDVDYFDEEYPSDAHWIYEPDPSLPHHRNLLRPNFCLGSKGYWTETNSLRSGSRPGWRHTNAYAYPVNMVDKPTRISRVLDWAAGLRITGIGRWGKWDHMNSDIAVKASLELGKLIR